MFWNGPDVNPAVNLWNDLRRAVYRRSPEYQRDLKRRYEEEWNKTTMCFESTQSRVTAELQAKAAL